MQQKKVIIIGAGIIGLSTAYKLLKQNKNLNITILEKEDDVAKHQTGNNSGVVHSGLYYKPGSLKAKNCVSGRKEILEFCRTFDIPCEKVGKIIVATQNEELPRLNDIEKRGQANGVEGLKIISREEAKEIEPHVNAIKALRVPNCHIVDYTKICLKIKDLIKKDGATIVFNEEVIEIDEWRVHTGHRTFTYDFLINAAGLHSDRIAKLALEEKVPLKILPFRGEYYELREEKRNLVNALIYPVPDPKFPFLGVHLTKMIDGSVEAGPNAVLAFAKEGYKKSDISLKDISSYLTFPGFWIIGIKYWKMGFYEMYRSFSKKAFLKSLQRLMPSIQDKDIVPGGSGIRAQAVGRNGKLLDDFSIINKHNQLHVLNAPSPAATACFSIGEHIATQSIDNMAKQ